MPQEPLDTSGFDLIFGIASAVVVLGVITVTTLIVLNMAKIRRAGHNPATLNADLAVRALDSELLAPAKTKDARLRELDDLRDRGVISQDEYRNARAGVLSAP